MNKWLESYHDRIPIDWWIFILAICIVALITISNVSWQTWKVSIENQASILKYE